VNFQAQSHATLTDTDVLILATTSTTPLYGPEDFATTLVISLGADSDTQHELDAHWAQHADLFVDTMDSQRYGDLHAWLAAGLVCTADLTDMIDVLRRPPAAPTRTRVFISTGSALFDNLTLGYLLTRLPANGG
jgi:ornithine cyclodeaminase/alanine dehydrogenase-like protein (mu-crystallin family)